FLISLSRIIIRIHYSLPTYSILKNQLLLFKGGNLCNTNGKGNKRVSIIGAGDSGEQILREILTRSDLKIVAVGFFDDDRSRIGSTIHGVPVLGSIEEINYFKNIFDEIIICIPAATNEQMQFIIERCKETGKKFRTLPAIWELIDGSVSVNKIREVSLVDILGRDEIYQDGNEDLAYAYLKGKRVLVTGAGGSIGSEVVRQCFRYEPELLILLDISEYNIFQIDSECNLRNGKTRHISILADIRNRYTIENILKKHKPEIIIHAAAYKHVPIQEKYPWEAIKTNISGSLNLIELAPKYKVESFIFVSSDKAVCPTNIMGATKRIVEMIINSKNNKSATRFNAVRFGNVIGSSGSVIPIFKEQIARGGPVTITDSEITRYFMSISEAARLILQAGALGRGGEIFVLEMGKPVKIDYLARELIKLSGFEVGKDIKIEYTGLRPGEKMNEQLILDFEELIPTKHEKIMILKSKITNGNGFNNNVKEIIRLSDCFSIQKIKTKMKEIIPEYEPGALSPEDY
ncbi:MAG TPA: polysaccharide biosynthesis protein, partial [bacterium]|nr:polysaccharide biosynthesis protein [bacterium]